MITRTHILTIAIEDHRDSSFETVVYAEQDAQSFVQAWREIVGDDVDCLTLVSDEATVSDVRAGLQKVLKSVGPNDRLVFFFCGHVWSMGGCTSMICFDTRLDYLETSSISLASLLNEIRAVPCEQVLLFLDGKHGAKSEHEFASEELRDFCKESAQRFAFISCKPKETSHVSGSLNHSIWTHCLIQSLNGDAKEAMDKDQRVTTNTLQSYLLAEVPRILRVTVAGAIKQTPVMYGSKTKELVLVDHAIRLQKNQLDRGHSANPIKDSCLTGEIRGRVRELRGYTKPKTTLSTHNDWERDFVEKAGAAEVTALATDIFEQLRGAFRYKRKDLSFTNIASTASIKGPDFDVNLSLSQDPEDAERYLLTTEVRAFRNAAIIDDPNFLAIFTKYCKRIEFELESSIDLESKIDDIEEIDALAENLEYDPECTEFTLKLPKAGINIHATGARMVFTLDAPGDLKLLLGNAQKAFTQLSGSHINLGFRANSKA